VAELGRILADAAPAAALSALARAGAFRLLDPRLRAGRGMLTRLARVPETLAWARARRVPAPAIELLGAALTAAARPDVGAAVLRRLGLAGAPFERVHGALAGARELAAALRSAARASEAARVLRAVSPTAVAWLHLEADAAARVRLERHLQPSEAGLPELGGEGVIALGVTRGPEVARVLGALRDARLDGEIRDRQGEIDYVRNWLAHHTERKG
jgi:tRNA nucleotidyltransferase (CCA-adding enzyme)